MKKKVPNINFKHYEVASKAIRQSVKAFEANEIGEEEKVDVIMTQCVQKSTCDLPQITQLINRQISCNLFIWSFIYDGPIFGGKNGKNFKKIYY